MRSDTYEILILTENASLLSDKALEIGHTPCLDREPDFRANAGFSDIYR